MGGFRGWSESRPEFPRPLSLETLKVQKKLGMYVHQVGVGDPKLGQFHLYQLHEMALMMGKTA